MLISLSLSLSFSFLDWLSQAADQFENIYSAFVKFDALQIEINPLAETPDGRGESCILFFLFLVGVFLLGHLLTFSSGLTFTSRTFPSGGVRRQAGLRFQRTLPSS